MEYQVPIKSAQAAHRGAKQRITSADLADAREFLKNRLCSLFLSVTATLMLLGALAGPVRAELPEGPGKATTVRLCGKCHSPEQAVSLHQDRDDWEDTLAKMVKLGAKGSDDEFESVLDYLAKNYGPETAGAINMNTATTVDLESSLKLGRSEAEAIVQYRTERGNFHSIEDLRKVPGLDFKKIEAKKSQLTF